MAGSQSEPKKLQKAFKHTAKKLANKIMKVADKPAKNVQKDKSNTGSGKGSKSKEKQHVVAPGLTNTISSERDLLAQN
ncbi:hypothetical protein [Dyadobacter crusticola]|uniref:hypothetical protein n=1 Tax=Dyadobacter crusticola TaxID=292407 RepID=UPI0004E0F1AD|nr:hypothetical protein [Dyadobacter crusticola]